MVFLPDDQKLRPSSQTSSIVKEKDLGFPESARPVERIPFIVEVGRIKETAAEQEGHIKRVGTDIELQKPVTDRFGQVLVTSPSVQKPKIVLPLTRSLYLDPANWHRPITYAIRWLLAWTKKIIKMNPGTTVFRE